MAQVRLFIYSLLAMMVLAGLYFVSSVLEQRQAQLSLQQQQIEQLKQQIKQLELDKLGLARDIATEERAGEALRGVVIEQQASVQDLQQQLRFYQKILAPETTARGASVESLQVMPLLSPGYYRLELVLMQMNRKRRWLSGEVEVLVAGSQNQQPVSYALEALLGEEQQADSLGFKFKYFQELAVELKLPEGFTPERLELKVKIKGDRWNKAAELEQSHSWKDLVNT